MKAFPSKRGGFGCLIAVLGALTGLYIGGWSFSAHVERMRAQYPGGVCGLPWIFAAFAGLTLGGLAGSVIGIIIELCLPVDDTPAMPPEASDDARKL